MNAFTCNSSDGVLNLQTCYKNYLLQTFGTCKFTPYEAFEFPYRGFPKTFTYIQDVNDSTEMTTTKHLLQHRTPRNITMKPAKLSREKTEAFSRRQKYHKTYSLAYYVPFYKQKHLSDTFCDKQLITINILKRVKSSVTSREQ